MPNDVAKRDGSLSWNSGCNSIAVTTLASEQTPGGLQRDELAWMTNCTCRDNGITQRAGIIKIATIPCEVLTATPPEHYYLSFVNEWIVPPVGSKVNVVLTQVYPGLDGDTFLLDGFWKAGLFASFGRYEVVSGAGTTNLTIRLIEETSVPPGDSVHDTPIVYHFFATHPNPCTSPYGRRIFQGMWPYRPSGADPYMLWSVSGNILRVDADGTTTNLSALFGVYNNPTEPFAFYVQGERFGIIQSGDNVTLPLIWDGAILRRSNGLTGNVGQPSAAVFTITTTNFFVVPIIGGTRTLLTAATVGLVNGTYRMRATGGSFDIGTFTVSNVIANTSFDITTVSSDWIGHNFPPFEYAFTDTTVPTPVLINEIPAATAMEYYASRIWYAIGRVVSAGDVVNGPSGTLAYNFKDSILKVTENPLAIGGDGFEMPSQDENIRGIAKGAAIDASLGQGRLFIFTRKAIYGLQVPVNRTDWIAANANNQPLITIVQLVNGSVNDRSIVPVNGDLYYQSLESGIRSLDQSVRQFSMAGNRLLSANVQRIMQFNDRSLLRAASGIYFNNRLLQTALPRQTPYGVVHDALVPLDFLPISTLQQDRKSNWEGNYSGVPIMQMQVLDFGGRERAFAAVLQEDNSFGLWELTTAEKFDFSLEGATQNRVEWYFETPAFNWSQSHGELELKKLVGAEIWADRISGTVVFAVDYRVNGTTCWMPYAEWTECSAKNTAETVTSPIGYPVNLGECFRTTMILPKPDPGCQPCNNNYPANIGIQFQARVRIKGFARIRGFWFWAEPVERGLYQPKLVCSSTISSTTL